MRVITLDLNKTVVSIKNVGDNYTLEINELVTDLGELGQIKQADGSFITPPPVPQQKLLTLEDLNKNQLTVMDAIANLYESLATKGVI